MAWAARLSASFICSTATRTSSWPGIRVRRNYVGEYCTSLDMAGTSITLSRLDDEIAGLLAAPAEIAIRTF